MMISCDWGTSAFRLRVVEAAPAGADEHLPGRVTASMQSSTGIASTFADWKRSGLPEKHRLDFYRAILQIALDDLQRQHSINLHGVPLIISGMASSSIGMMELPYHPLPFSLSGEDLEPALLPATADFPHTIVLVPGIRSADDVMRGEETQLIGVAGRLQPGEARLFMLPGTHSKHILTHGGQAVGFDTYMTGEFFSLLSKQSILAASVESSPLSFEAFIAGIDAVRNSSILHSAFLVRTNELFGNFSKADNYHYLSGLLIGEELKGLGKLRPLTLVAVAPILRSYQLALERLGFHSVEIIDADRALVEGHCRLFDRYVRGTENA
jgi:2-dehydro-3-deoxygalactonokinase